MCGSAAGSAQSALGVVAAELEQQKLAHPLTYAQLQELTNIELREAALGERMYALVVLSGRTHRPGKVTGMLLDGLDAMDLSEILLSRPADAGAAALLSWIEEACTVLFAEASTTHRMAAHALQPPLMAAPGPAGAAPPAESDGQHNNVDTDGSGDAEVASGGSAAITAPTDEWQVVSSRCTKRRSRASR